MSIKCSDIRCKNQKNGECILNGEVQINSCGCASFERSIFYYFNLVWNALSRKNFIDVVELTDDLRIGMYYVMSVYHIGVSEMEWGTCRILMFKQEENGSALAYKDIVALPADEKVLQQLYEEYNAGILPGDSRPLKPVEKLSQPFGWLSPTGQFTEGGFGNHEETAQKIIMARGFESEFRQGAYANGWTARDFLNKVKGYCLIHNPLGDGGYIVSYRKPLTKQQRKFLYSYFMDMGDYFKAEQFIESTDS